MTVLRALLARLVPIVRLLAVGYVILQVAIWHSFYTARPWLLWGPAVAVAWGTAAAAALRHRQAGWRFICLDTAVYALLALTAECCVPGNVRGQAGDWLFIAVISQFVLPVWFAPAALGGLLTLTSTAGFWAGSALAPLGHGSAQAAVASGLLMLAVVAMHWAARQMLYGRAGRADLVLAAADLDAREQYVVLSRTVERREHERLLHDTVLNTLTAVSRAGCSDAVIARCQQDIRRLEQVLSEPADPAAAASAGGRLLAGIEAVAAEMRGRGLTVHVETAAGRAGRLAGLAVPRPVAEAVAQAAREALANVAAHAGTGEAWVTVGLRAPAGPTRPGSLRVTVRDEGAGFDPARVPPARLGLRRSITERVADAGGSASVWSAPGRGTVVSLGWALPAEPAVADSARAADSAGRGVAAW